MTACPYRRRASTEDGERCANAGSRGQGWARIASVLLLLGLRAVSAGWLFLPLGSEDAPQLTGLPPRDITASSTPSCLAARLRPPTGPNVPTPVWQPASFPHSDFDRLYPGRDAYGVYACVLDLPRELASRDMILFLGVVDDSDMAYVNGRPVGAMGDFEAKGSAWNADREYRVPAEVLESGENVVLVRVHDIWGLGGIVGPPAIGLALAPKDAAWSFSAAAANPAQTGPSAPQWIPVPIPDTGFAGRLKVPPATGRYRLEFELPAGLARVLTVPGTPGPILDLGPVFDAAAVRLNGNEIGRCGLFRDAGQPSEADPGTSGPHLQTARRVRCFLPHRLLREGGNVLDVEVYWTGQFGGLPGTPMVLLPGQAGAADAAFPDLARDLDLADVFAQSSDLGAAARLLKGVVRDIDRRERREEDVRADVGAAARDSRHPAGRDGLADGSAAGAAGAPPAGGAAAPASEEPGPVPGPEDALPPATRAQHLAQLRARALSDLAYIDFLEAREAGNGRFPFVGRTRRDLRAVAQGLSRLLREHPTESIGQDGMQAACAVLRSAESDPRVAKAIADELPSFNARVRYLGQDRETRGDWPMLYGGEGYALAAMGQTVSWFEGLGMRCRVSIPGGRDVPRCWLDPAGRDVADPRALLVPGRWRTELAKAGPPPAEQPPLFPLLPGVPVRRAAWWDDHGEESAFDERGPDLLVHLDIPEGEHRIAFYCLDFDWYATRHPRQQSVLITGPAGELLNAAWTGKFGEGVYERFAVTGPIRLTARVSKHRGACVALSGVFFDAGPSAAVPPGGSAGSDACALLAAGAPPRDVYLASAALFRTAPSWEPQRLRATLEAMLLGCSDPSYQPLRAWVLALWRARGFDENAVTRHAQERLDLAMRSTGKAVSAGTVGSAMP